VSPPRDRTAARAAIVLLVSAAVWAGAIVAAPVLASTAGPAAPALIASVTIYGVGGLVCHQRADRSFHSARLRWPVCARCAGLYLSAGVGSLVVLVSRHWWRRLAFRRGARTIALLLTAAAPTVASWVLERMDLIATGNMLRAVLAAPLGFAVAGVLAYVWRAAEGSGK
jgi:uncharacterized membrane protein